MASLYTKEHFLELLKEKGRNDLILTGDYVNANIPATFKCSDENCGCEWETKPVYVLHGKGGCPKCRKRKLSEFHKLSREEYEKRLLKIRPTLHIEGEFNRGYAPVTLCCDKGHRWNVPQAKIALNKGGDNRGCPYCNGLLVDSETNSIYALRKDLLKYFKNPEEAKNLGLMSEKKIKLVCPDCGHETEMMVQNFTRRGFYCKYCKKDGVSFPNKILRGLLKQLKFEWDVEVGFDWSKNYKYDGYLKIKDKQYLIEMHGMQHYKDTSFSTVEFQAERDQEKRSLAEQNGFVEIEIDCHFSSFELVRENLEKSFLSEIINFSGISWEKVYEEVGNNYVKMAADMYNKRQKITEIASKMKLARHTIRGYLKDASCIGWCNYDKK